MPNAQLNQPVIAEYSGDALSIGTVTLRDANGDTISLDSTTGFAMTDLIAMVTSVACRLDLINDTDAGGDVDAGERVVGGNFAANGGLGSATGLRTPVYFKKNTLPKLKSDTSGIQTITMTGFIYR